MKKWLLDLGDNENESEDIVGSIDVAMPIVLPSISAVRAMDETGRDLGLAKRVAHLVGKRSYFAQKDEETVCDAESEYGKRAKRFDGKRWASFHVQSGLSCDIFSGVGDSTGVIGLGFTNLSKENQFHVLSRMAMDILSVQASSVASESAFSTSGRLLTIRRTRLTLESLEMCICSLADGSLSSGERRRDYMMSSGAEDDQTGEGGSMSHGYTYY
ncbi:zinc finger BED domain-containing protein RICESLEEPER 3 [Tanacetum coccineum]